MRFKFSIHFKLRLIVSVAALSALVGCGAEDETARTFVPEPLNIEAATIAPSAWSWAFESYGYFESAEEVIISAEFPGVVKAVNFDQGGAIRAGDTLIELEGAKQYLYLQLAEAGVARVKANLDNRQSTYQRYAQLVGRGTVSKEKFEQSRAQFETAQADLQQVLAEKSLAARDVVELQLVSPVDGVVAERNVDEGQKVLQGQSLAVVQVNAVMRVVTYVTEKEVNYITVGDVMEVAALSVPGFVYSGRIEVIARSADSNTGKFVVKLAVDNKHGYLREGMSAKVKMKIKVESDAILVPMEALVDRNRRRVLFLYSGGVARMIEPVLGMHNEADIRVLDGVKGGDKVIVSPLSLITDGKAVQLN